MSDQLDLEKAAKKGDGCAMRDALMDLPYDEHLQAIRDLKQSLGNGSGLDINISPDSTASHFEFSITKSGPSSAVIDDLAKKLGISADKLGEIAKNARKDLPAVTLVHESHDFNVSPGKFNFSNSFECRS